jgi:hypothetical protein
MVVKLHGSPVPVIGMAVTMEGAKLITAGWLAPRWSATAVVWRLALIAFVAGLAVINAAGVYAQLVSAHVGERGVATSRIEERTAELDVRIDVQAHKIAVAERERRVKVLSLPARSRMQITATRLLIFSKRLRRTNA